MQPDTVLRLSGITKRFGSLVANDAISLDLARGEVLALLGENGAGKTTLVSILFGHYVADDGHDRGLRPAAAAGPAEGRAGRRHRHGAPALHAGRQPERARQRDARHRAAVVAVLAPRRGARASWSRPAQRFGLQVDPDARIADLSVGERQRVEILKALVRGARILILDEPTAVLTPQESESLFDTLRQMVAQGLSIIFISHKLDEVLRVSHRIAVLRGGKLVAELPAAGADKAQLAETDGRPRRCRRRRAGRARRRRRVPAAGRHACVAPTARPRCSTASTWTLRAGEIVAIAGVSGNGQEALAELLFGLHAPSAGTLELHGRACRRAPRGWVARGVARIPEDRHAVGVVGDLPVWENAVLERYACRPSRAPASCARRGAGRMRAR